VLATIHQGNGGRAVKVQSENNILKVLTFSLKPEDWANTWVLSGGRIHHGCIGERELMVGMWVLIVCRLTCSTDQIQTFKFHHSSFPNSKSVGGDHAVRGCLLSPWCLLTPIILACSKRECEGCWEDRCTWKGGSVRRVDWTGAWTTPKQQTHTHFKTLTHFHPLYVHGASSSGFSRY